MMNSNLEADFRYFIQNQAEFAKEHFGKFIVIKDSQVVGVYESEVEAVEETSKIHEIGSFIVQECTPGEGAFTQTFRTRVVFA